MYKKSRRPKSSEAQPCRPWVFSQNPGGGGSVKNSPAIQRKASGSSSTGGSSSMHHLTPFRRGSGTGGKIKNRLPHWLGGPKSSSSSLSSSTPLLHSSSCSSKGSAPLLSFSSAERTHKKDRKAESKYSSGDLHRLIHHNNNRNNNYGDSSHLFHQHSTENLSEELINNKLQQRSYSKGVLSGSPSTGSISISSSLESPLSLSLASPFASANVLPCISSSRAGSFSLDDQQGCHSSSLPSSSHAIPTPSCQSPSASPSPSRRIRLGSSRIKAATISRNKSPLAPPPPPEPEEGGYFALLPMEILYTLMIDYLNPEEVSRLSATCKLWYHCCGNDSVWKKFFIRHFGELLEEYEQKAPSNNSKRFRFSQLKCNYFWRKSFMYETLRFDSAFNFDFSTLSGRDEIKIVLASNMGRSGRKPSGVGKSAITVQFIQGNFKDEFDPTIADIYRKEISLHQSCSIVCDVLDTAGQEEYTAMRDQYFRCGQCFILVYSIDHRCSFEGLTELVDQILRVKEEEAITQVPMVLACNKIDLPQSAWEVSMKEGKALARKLEIPFVKVSAKTRVGVEWLFELAAAQYFICSRRRENETQGLKTGPPDPSHFFTDSQLDKSIANGRAANCAVM